MTVNDVAIIMMLILLIPKLVEKHLAGYGISQEVRMTIMIGGMLWIVSNFISEDIKHILNVTQGSDISDQVGLGYSNIIPALEGKHYRKVLMALRAPGSSFIDGALGIFYHFTGGTHISIRALCAFMPFWGNLVLIRLVYDGFKPFLPLRNRVLTIFIAFAPSVVFWSGHSLKDPLMYWSICQVFAWVRHSESPIRARWSFFLFIIGASLGLSLRPHILLFWLMSVLFVKVFHRHFFRRYWKHTIVLILVAPIFSGGVVKRMISPTSFEENVRLGEKRMRHIIHRGKKFSSIKATFDYGKSGPIFILSGAKNILFRPILWRARSFRGLLSAVEIWMISLGIIVLWMRMTGKECRTILKNPSIWVAFLVLIPFCMFFTYLPNEGLIARQRIQVFPALLVLFATPIVQRQSAKRETGSARRMEQRAGRAEDR